MKGQQKTSFATATAKVFQTDDLYAKQISSVTKLTLSDGTDVVKLLDKLTKNNEETLKTIVSLSNRLKEAEDKLNSIEIE